VSTTTAMTTLTALAAFAFAAVVALGEGDLDVGHG
jgi:hypothetical protein